MTATRVRLLDPRSGSRQPLWGKHNPSRNQRLPQLTTPQLQLATYKHLQSCRIYLLHSESVQPGARGMAPLIIRQSHSFTPSPPRPSKGPFTAPISVKAHIKAAVFGELFAGTVGIFILAVIFWKVGKYIRSLNRHRVLREGKLTTARFARTWYGWVPIEVHQRNKTVLANAFKWIIDWLSWESSRNDYSWVWWDPGQETLQKCQRQRRTPKWMPRFLQSKSPCPADQIWNPGSLAECHGALLDTLGSEIGQATELSMARSIIGIRRSSQESNHHLLENSGSSSTQEWFKPREQMDGSYDDNPSRDSQVLDVTVPAMSPTPFHHACSPTIQSNYAMPPWRIKSQSFPDLEKGIAHTPKPVKGQGNLQLIPYGDLLSLRTMPRNRALDLTLKPPYWHSELRKCRVWSAKMQAKANNRPIMCELRDSSGPPGTPFVEMLSSFLSEESALDSAPTQRESVNNGQLKSPVDQLPALFSRYHEPKVPHRAKALFHTAPARLRQQVNPMSKSSQRERKSGFQKMSFSEAQSSSQNDITFSGQILGQTDFGLYDWEIRLIDGLNRKLVWIFDETTPGQKPYHFAQLANHWLNRETWLVIDPVSRVPIYSRREWGDPRFNVPYPEATYNPKPKYQIPGQKRAYTPRIDSWRATVNRQRRVSGLRDVVRAVELYENSIEEIPDGHIDPGSWMLPRPPQGFEVSTKQKNAWYEGGTGWQETFEDWQQIRRGYRLRKFLHEGRVNRNWVKGITTRVHQYCRSSSLKAKPKDIQRLPAPSLAVS